MAQKRTGCLTWIAVCTLAPMLICCSVSIFIPRNPLPVPVANRGAPQADVIPGLQPVDVYLNLTKRGFTRRGPIQTGAVYSSTCTLSQDGMEFECRIEGSTSMNVTSVQATALNIGHPEEQTDELATWFLGFVASLPYEGAASDANRAWAESHAGGGSMTQGGVRFELLANSPKLRLLTITPARSGDPSNPDQ